MTLTRRASILAPSLLAVALGLAWDHIHPGGGPGLGPLQLGLCAVGLAAALLAIVPAVLRLLYARALLACGSLYLSAFAVELVLMPPLARWGLVAASQQGMVQRSSWGGYELTPGWSGRYEDGLGSAEVTINALGDRDDQLSPRELALDERVLLLGDSFTFGWGLPKQDTVEGRIEAESAGRAVAYNLGVGGYGPGDTLEHYRERATFPATHTFFLLYGNDLRQDNCTVGFHTAVGGMIVPRAKANGAAYTAEDVEQRLRAALQEDGELWIAQLKGALVLQQLRGRLAWLARRDEPLATGAPEQYTPECALAAAARAAEMREIARARGQRFAVVVLPTPGEAQRRTYAESMNLCLRELERRGIPVLEVRDRLSRADFFPHHEHLNAAGTQKVAQAILAAVESQASAASTARPPIAQRLPR